MKSKALPQNKVTMAVSSLSAAPFGGKTDHRRAWSCCDCLAKKAVRTSTDSAKVL
jgi:hypothetical protein